MTSFEFFVPTRIVFQEHAVRNKLVEQIRALKVSSIILITDRGVVGAGLLKEVVVTLDQAGIVYAVFDQVEPNPSTDTCMKAFQTAKEIGAGATVAIGGGSSMDVAKAVGILMTNGGDLESYEGPDKFENQMLPMIGIPTTAGTGSELTPFAVITIRARHYKMTIFSIKCLPQVALLDPTLLSTVPPPIAAACGMDALTHAVESFINRQASPVTDAYACEAIRLIGKHLRAYVANRENLTAAGAMLVASSLAGVSFGVARLGNVHAMAHPLGGFFDLPHGIANAILLPHVMRFNLLADSGKYRWIAELLGEDTSGLSDREAARLAIDVVVELSRDVGIPGTLSEVGVTADLIPSMSADAMKSGNILINPRQTTLQDIESLFRAAM
ncbi:MAG: iron-containing alcohol dehydrogenase [Syntrophales bacterium]